MKVPMIPWSIRHMTPLDWAVLGDKCVVVAAIAAFIVVQLLGLWPEKG